RPASPIAFSPDGRLLATHCAAEVPVKVWEVATGRLRFEARSYDNRKSLPVFSPDNRLLATGAPDVVHLWDTASGRLLRDLPVDSLNICFHPDSRRLATANKNGLVQVWDAQSGQLLFAKPTQSQFLKAIAFSGDGLRLVASCADRAAVPIWDAT